MKIKVLEETPRKVLEFPLDNDLNLTEKEVEDVAEIFKTPLTVLTIGITQYKIIVLKDSMSLEKS